MRIRLMFGAALSVLVAQFAVPVHASAAVAGPGRILFQYGAAWGGLGAINVDGSNAIQLTENTFDQATFLPPPDSTKARYRSYHPTSSALTGKIAFQSNRNSDAFRIFIMNADATGVRQLTFPNDAPCCFAEDISPAISPDGSRIAFASQRSGYAFNPQRPSHDIFMVNSDGTGLHEVTPLQVIFCSNGVDVCDQSDITGLAWSPDGTRLAFRGKRLVQSGFHDVLGIINADGSNEVDNVVDDCAGGRAVDWSSTGTILYTYGGAVQGCPMIRIELLGHGELFTTNSDFNQVSPFPGTVRFSPDGSQIAFSTTNNANGNLDVVNTDGSGLTQLSFGMMRDNALWWMPGPAIPTPASFALTPDPIFVSNGGPSVQAVATLYDASGNVITHGATGWDTLSEDGTYVSYTGLVSARDTPIVNRPLCANNDGFRACTTIALNQQPTDTIPPTISCSPPDPTKWYSSNVNVGCTAADSGSGLANASDASFTLATSVTQGTETSAARTGSRQVCDVAGNCAVAGPYSFMVDLKPPTVTCAATPSFALRQPGATVSATVTDGGSGPAQSPVSAPADTSTVGTHAAAVTGYDAAGNSNTLLCPYTVGYVFSGFLPPITNPNAINSGKAGRTYPVKWMLTDYSGAFVTSLIAVRGVLVEATSCSDFSTDPSSAISTSTTGATSLRYDSTANQYVYNWATAAPGCYTLFLELDSGQVFPAYFSLS